MNNLRLLRGVAFATLLSGGLCAAAQSARTYTLEELFDIAESNSTQLRPAITARNTAEKAVSEAKTARLPEISASVSVGFIGDGFTTARNFSDYQIAPIPHFSNTAAVSVEQPVYAGGAITASIEMAELKSTAARFSEELNRDNIRFQIAGFYLDLYKYHNLRRVLQANIDQTKRVLEEMRSRYDQGVVLKNDITRYELLLSNLELELVRIDNTLTIISDNLTTVTGLEPGTTVSPDTTILARSLPVTAESDWLTAADTNSPAVKLARSGVDISQKAETLAKADRLPKVGIQAGWNLDGPILVEVPPINRNLSYWFVGVGVKYSLSSLFKTNKSIARSKAASIEASARLDATRENVELAVRADYVRYREAYEVLKSREKSVELAVTNYNTTSTRFFADMALLTDMLDAANSKLDAEQQLVNARINIIYQYYKLLFTSGQI